MKIMIEIIPFNKSLFSDYNIDNFIITKYCYVNDIDLIAKLMSIKYPISNLRLALRNVLDFLAYVDSRIDMEEKTILPISSSILIDFFGRDNYKEYMDILRDLNILTKVPYSDGTFYQKGSLYLQYRIHNEYIKKEDLAIIILDEDRSKDIFVNEVKDLDIRYENTIKKLEINIKEAIKDEINYYKENNLSIFTLRNRISRLFYTRRKRFIKTGKKVNRIYHSFSNVSKVSRSHLNIKMLSIDIVNCQPLLLAAYLKKQNIQIDSNYQNDCELGLFYERFLGINNLDRDEIKVQLYKNIFFAFNERSKFNKRFKELYPLTWKALNDINSDNISLASLLQNIEAELFNNLIPKKSKHYFTLFDSIYFDNMSDMPKLVNNINEFFNKLEIKAKIKVL